MLEQSGGREKYSRTPTRKEMTTVALFVLSSYAGVLVRIPQVLPGLRCR